MPEVAHSIDDEVPAERRRSAVKPSSSSSTLVSGATAIVLVGVLVGLALGVRDIRVVLNDDAAITLRYAARIAAGEGWTYNDGDRTNGASAPLYTMVLALLHLTGLNLETAAKAVGVACFAANFGLAARLGERIGGPVAGVAAIVLLAGSTQFRVLSAYGMESGLAATLGLTAILFASYRREWLAGVLVGLAVVNKLDAVFLAIAIAVGLTVAYRQLPWRLVGGAVATFAPWAIFAQLYFGSVLPYSAAEKLSGHVDEGFVLDHGWVVDSIRSDRGGPVVVLGVAALLGVVELLLRRQRALAAGLLALVLWPTLHIVAFSYLDFGAPYPWYITVVFPPITVAAACTLGLIVRSGWRTPSVVARMAAVGLVLGLSGYAICHHRVDYRQAKETLTHGHRRDGAESFDETRRKSGIWLGQNARPGDIVQTCFGWPAYGSLQATIKETCRLSTRKPVAAPRWIVVAAMHDPVVVRDPGFSLVRSFVSTHPEGGSTQIYERDGS